MSIVLLGSTSGSVTLQEPAVAGTTVFTLPATSGTVVVTGTTPSLNGIAFPATQSASADANTLDDYEEGTFTPTLIDPSNNEPSTYGARVGTYTKIGNQVTIQVYLAVTTVGGTISGSLSIGNMPFTSSSTTNAYQGAWCGYWATMATNLVFVGGFFNPNTTKIALYRATSATASLGAMQASDWANTADIMISCTYRTS
jgi:hypothetical protein